MATPTEGVEAALAKLPDDVKTKLSRLSQEYEIKIREYESTTIQLRSMESEKASVERALQRLEKLPDDVRIYENLELVLVEVKKDEAKANLLDRKEFLKLNISKLKKQAEEILKEARRIDSEIREILSAYGLSRGESG
ncbi:MAG: hypothetical protein DRN81_02790 [Thermoproteota archaeon]|nr:MAG: hypothetical protein DRN81_02790 [Candidatus Korarchaeota archaeon]